ncbi:Lipoprotein signal peptidase [Geobacillus sp. BCO2]|nr:Lipoprotein signal peptidase [Geobacillus sp. BCO2]
MAYYWIAAAVVILDQWTKWLVVRYMRLGESIPIIDNVLYITSHRNRGAAWGMLEGQFWLFLFDYGHCCGGDRDLHPPPEAF